MALDRGAIDLLGGLRTTGGATRARTCRPMSRAIGVCQVRPVPVPRGSGQGSETLKAGLLRFGVHLHLVAAVGGLGRIGQDEAGASSPSPSRGGPLAFQNERRS